MAARHPFLFRASGFTLTELVVVIVLISIVSVYAAYRLDRTPFETRTVYDQLAAQVAHARRMAIAQRRSICVHLSAGQSVLQYDDAAPGTCNPGNGVPSPSGATPFTVNAGNAAFAAAPGGLPQVVRFDPAGRYLTAAGAVPAASLVITVAGDGAHQLVVERESGYVHP
jgi:MSHA pilin protein MshC